MLTTGGGWQDQVGGLTGGIKLVTTGPGLPQRITVEPVALPPDTAAGLAARPGHGLHRPTAAGQKPAPLHHGPLDGADPEMVWLQNEIARLAVAMRHALLTGDLDGFGELLGEHWTLNKRMDPGCTNPFIDDLFRVMEPTCASSSNTPPFNAVNNLALAFVGRPVAASLRQLAPPSVERSMARLSPPSEA